jgi:hypothetical protein
MSTHSLVTHQGTAMPESTLCGQHLTEDAARDTAVFAAEQSEDWDGEPSFHDSTGNDCVSCIVCGTNR